MMRRALTALLCAAAVVPAAGASPQRGFAFGQAGGNIRPFTVAVGIDGDVKVTGRASVGRMHLTRLQLGELNRLAVTTSFGALPALTNCKGSLPDFATSFIRVGARTVRVRGGCMPGYQRLWKALAADVRLAKSA
jgi:hypothetical protein